MATEFWGNLPNLMVLTVKHVHFAEEFFWNQVLKIIPRRFFSRIKNRKS